MNDDIIYVDSYDFDRRIEQGTNMVFFFSRLCTRSRAMMPIIEEIADEYYDCLRVLALDVEQSPDVADVFAVEMTPTVLFFMNGHLLERVEEANPKTVYTDVIETILSEESTE